MHHRHRIAGLLAVLAATAAAGCGSSSKAAPDGASILNAATAAAVTTWDPVASFSTEVYFLANAYEPLLYANPPGAPERFRPALATRWERSADARRWTFHLRPGVTFHDGEPLTSAAVKASIEAVKERGGAAFLWAALRSISTPDRRTVVFEMTAPTEVDVAASSMYGAWIVSPRALRAAARDRSFWDEGKDAGTGPYEIARVVPGKQVVLEANPGYWGGFEKGRHFETVDVQIVGDAIAGQQMLESGQVQLAGSLPLENVKRFERSGDFKVEQCTTSLSYLGFFNTAKKPLDDPRVREAISWAIPYEDIIEVGAHGYGTQSRGPVPEGVFPYDPAVPQYRQDLAKARALLAEAGHPGGGFDLRMTYAAENQQEKQFAPLIKDALASVGIDVQITPKLFPQQWEEGKGAPEKAQDVFLLLYWPTNSDAGADNLYSLFRSSEQTSFNLSYWRDARYDRLVDEAIATTATDRDRAQALYTQAMRRLVSEAPGFYLYDEQHPVVVPRYLTGFECNPNYSFNLFFHRLGIAES